MIHLSGSNLCCEMFQVKLDQIKKEQKNLVQEMERAVYRHTNLYVEADKQALFGKRRKTPEYVKKRIRNNIKKINQDKKVFISFSYNINNLFTLSYKYIFSNSAKNKC